MAEATGKCTSTHLGYNYIDDPGQTFDADRGQYWSGEIEAGTAKITRYQDGRPTRFTFKKPFQKAPHVQFTPDFGDNPAAGFKQSWLYFLGQGKPAVDKEGFTVGCFTDVGHELTFRYTAIEIRERY